MTRKDFENAAGSGDEAQWEEKLGILRDAMDHRFHMDLDKALAGAAPYVGTDEKRYRAWQVGYRAFSEDKPYYSGYRANLEFLGTLVQSCPDSSNLVIVHTPQAVAQTLEQMIPYNEDLAYRGRPDLSMFSEVPAVAGACLEWAKDRMLKDKEAGKDQTNNE